jgi:hydrophobic/amphiphilic exporter-1 (mainly G- bacteria), HAE1 family
MQWLAEICVKRPVFATVLSLVILVVGSAFYGQLGVDQFPKIDFPAVVVFTRLPGAAPTDVETEISDKIEGAVNTISGIDELRSVSSEGLSQVLIQFILEKNVDVAAQEVQQKVSGVLSELPRGIETPIVQKFDPDAQPILYIALNAKEATTRQVTDIADRVVRRRLENINGVGEVRLLGGQKRQVNVSVDPVKMKALGITPAEISRAIDAQNLSSPGGRVDTSRDYYTVRINGRVQSVAELERIIVREQNGRAVRLNEVASVEDGTEDLETSAVWNGKRTVLLTLRKQSGTNTVAVIDAVKERMKEIQTDLPAGYVLDVQRDASLVIRTGIDAVSEHLVLGALFAAIIVFLFLGNLRSTVIAAVAIPTSIIGTFALMFLKGYSLNSITLLALALAVGIVIDDAIVVLENIFKQVEEKGMQPAEAAIHGTREIGLAVLATTLSLIAVFLPIAFVAGIPGRFLASFGVTMSFAIAVSLFVSFTLTPSLAARWLKAKPVGGHHVRSPLERIVDVFYRPIENLYMKILAFSMSKRWIIAVASLVALVSTCPLGAKAKKGFLPVDDRAQFELVVRLPEGRSVAASELIGERIARLLRERPEVIATLVTVGDDAQKTPNLARVYVKMLDPVDRAITQNDFKDVVRKEILTKLPPDLRVQVADVNEFGGGQATQRIQYSVAGPDLDALAKVTPGLIEKIKAIPGAVDVDSTLIVGKPEFQVNVDRDRAADLGVQVADIAQALNLLLGGLKVSTYSEGGEQYDIRMRSEIEYRSNEDALRLMTVPSRRLGVISLSEVVTIAHGESPSTINRFQRERQVVFMANAGPGASEGEISALVKQTLDESGLPAGFTVKAQGQTKLMAETGKSFVFGLLASFVFMYLILAAQFESWLHPITILLSLPLTLPFAVASVIIFDQALDLYSFLGIFVLFGVVKKNAILQIDHTNHLREQGMSRYDAIMLANKDRLRPILMTTFAFVAGMIPLVTAQGIGSGYNKATAGVVVGGQVLSLILTLVAVPVAYSYFDDLSIWLKRKFSRRSGTPNEHAVTHAQPVSGLEEASK